MFIEGAGDTSDEEEEVNSVNWEYQITESRWILYPKSISLLIERQHRNNQQHIPLFYQKSNGDKFKIKLSNLLEFNLQNNWVTPIRRQYHSETKSVDYAKCPQCFFQISPDTLICDICDTNIQQYLFQQYSNNYNHSSSVKQEASEIYRDYENTQHLHKYTIINKHLLDKPQLKRLRNNMKIYKQDMENINNIDIKLMLNDFLYLSTFHDNYAEFEDIYNELGGFCELKCCNSFKRNYRDRNKRNIDEKQNFDDEYGHYGAVQCQIMDKIHCYYSHCFDIGHGLTMNERSVIDNIKSEHSLHDESDDWFIDKQIGRITQLLSNKHKKLHNKSKQKYIQLDSIQNEENERIPNNNKTYRQYSFGRRFIYDSSKQNVKAKFSSIKEEITGNEIATIAMTQFINEYGKAQIYFDSDFCQKNYDNISLNHLLSLMLYCNFDNLQYEFSKTYRGKDIINHTQFYHLGKYLKKAVQDFGKMIKNDTIKAFYHGISEQLLFPQILGVDGNGVHIYCPLSTSSSFHVATNFTNYNQGLIVEFSGGHAEQAKYFSVSWLSDYGNEEEHLFLQNKMYLEIENITHAEHGYVNDVILKALKIFDTITRDLDTNHISKDIDNMMVLIMKIIKHKLSNKISKYKPFNSLHEYAKELINIYCKNRKRIFIDYSNYQTKCLYKSFFYAHDVGIKLDLIHILFPNIELFTIKSINLSPSLFESILRYFNHENINSINSKLNDIFVSDTDNDKSLATKYYQQLEKVNFVPWFSDESDKLYIRSTVNSKWSTRKLV